MFLLETVGFKIMKEMRVGLGVTKNQRSEEEKDKLRTLII